jgi:integrase
MARKVRDKAIDSREARRKLAPQDTCHWRSLERGLHLGYRRIKTGTGTGTWWARHYLGDQQYETESLGIADDLSDADGVAVLDYWQAQEKARGCMVRRAHAAAGKTGPYTVADTMEAYFRFLANDGRGVHTIRDARYRDNAFIRPNLGWVEVAALTADKLRQWRDDLVQTPPRVRTKKNSTQNHRKITDDNARRARKSSANRTWSILRAALNHAFHDGKVPSDLEWRKVKPFRSVDAARVRYLTVAEAKRLINAAEPDFRMLVQAALQTGARYGELARLTVADFNPDVGTLTIQQSKSGRARHVVLTDEGTQFFRRLCAGRAGGEPLLRKTTGSPWDFAHQIRPMDDTVARSKISPPISFHGLRHTWASHAIMNGMPLMVVARNLGHADTRMVEKHYGHLAPSYVADAVRKSAPRFGLKSDHKIASLR